MNEYIPYSRQNITKDDIDAVVSVLKSPYLTSGPTVPMFEDAISSKVKSKYSIATNSATSALHIACLSLGLKEGDYIWTSPITFVASANCGLYCGAKVDFVDINPITGLIDINKLSSKLHESSEKGTLPKIFIPVHLAGTSCDMEEIQKLSIKYGFSIIEDASHAIGGEYKRTPVGSCKYSDITIFSFHPVKIITTGEGGLATTNNPEIANKLRELRSHGINKDQSKFFTKNPPPWLYEQTSLGFNYRMNDIQASLGLNQFKRLDEIVKKRNRKFEIYLELIKDLPIKFLKIPDYVYSSLHLAIICFKDINAKKHRDIFIEMRNKNIGVQLHYSPVHLQPFYKKLGFKKGEFPNAEKYSESSFSIPLFPEISFETQHYVIQCLKNSLLIK